MRRIAIAADGTFPFAVPTVLALAAVAAGCGPGYMAAGYDAKWACHGPMAATVDDVQGESGSVGVGMGSRAFAVEAWIHGHNVTSQSLALPSWSADQGLSTEAPRYLGASSSLMARWGWLQKGPVTVSLSGGPTRALLIDRMSGERSWGTGYRYGTGFELAMGPITASVSAYRGELYFAGGPADGHSTLVGTTLGLAVSR
ncbi:MAG: hypothetical protein KBG28_32120 [Kofleriaceae bacterium]|jgi:hypothetical protein|nr:hypothetical protein [Kofleriaceae bacterium]MBP6836094.1 hypothetical protein [Kofleriaceae bacterium]MBP9208657.1 hypothetical protein [Kofleriaceae bacterium]